MKRHTVLIFDFDGTIADTMAIVLEVGNEILRSFGMTEVEEARIPELREMTIPELMKEFKIPLYRLPSFVTTARKHIKERMDDIEPIPGMVELVQHYHQQEDVTLALITSNTRDNVDFFLDKYGFADCFDHIYGDVGLFTKYVKIRSITRRLGKGSKVIAIGDEIRDAEAAKIASIYFVGVEWGMSTANRLVSAGAHKVVKSSKQLRNVLDYMIG